jgi:hypothetical protein
VVNLYSGRKPEFDTDVTPPGQSSFFAPQEGNTKELWAKQQIVGYTWQDPPK